MYKKQYEDEAWTCYNFELIFISIWNVLNLKKNNLKTRGINKHVGEGGEWRVGTFASVLIVDTVFKTT